MKTSTANMRRPRRPAKAIPATIPGHSPVRMDGECLLPAGGEPLHGPSSSQLPEATRFAASHIEPIESEA